MCPYCTPLGGKNKTKKASEAEERPFQQRLSLYWRACGHTRNNRPVNTGGCVTLVSPDFFYLFIFLNRDLKPAFKCSWHQGSPLLRTFWGAGRHHERRRLRLGHAQNLGSHRRTMHARSSALTLKVIYTHICTLLYTAVHTSIHREGINQGHQMLRQWCVPPFQIKSRKKKKKQTRW